MSYFVRSVAGLLLLFWIAGCSIPTLEPADCVEARSVVKKLYSAHFDRGFAPEERYIRYRDSNLSEEFAKEFNNDGGFDPLTQTKDFPMAFRIGACEQVGEDRIDLDMLLFWKDDTSETQKSIKVETTRTGSDWKVSGVRMTQ